MTPDSDRFPQVAAGGPPSDPPAGSERTGTAVCLSGGGFRAALFHLGGMRRLNELGILGSLHEVSSVSGGSILAAHLALRIRPWPRPGEAFPEWDRQVRDPVWEFTGHNRRKHLCTRFWNLFLGDRATRAMAREYEKLLPGASLSSLPERPRFSFCATDLVYGVNWTFTRATVGSYQAGRASAPDFPLALAVAASANFPPVFRPLLVPSELGDRLRHGSHRPHERRRRLNRKLLLSDGGVYDNLGLEPVWKRAGTVLVSDGGTLLPAANQRFLLKELSRYTAIQGSQIGALRKRWLIAGYERKALSGGYWGVGSAASRYGIDLPHAYSKNLARTSLAGIRTDLDAFSTAEAEILENHGYALAEATIRTHAPHLVARDAPFQVPHPEWTESRAEAALATSSRRRFCGRS